jgi:hypothetical protein
MRRADDQWQKDAAADEQNKKVYTETVEKSSSAWLSCGLCIFHCLIHRNNINMPHR